MNMNTKDVIRTLDTLGYIPVKRTRGDHIKFKNNTGNITLVPDRANKQIAAGTLSAICRQIGITKKEFVNIGRV